jgi:tetratricopeptide (TPR) repeat protein
MSDSTAENTTGSVPGKATSKAASAGCPVEETERISQQERLRKAAAAGAHALKSPLSTSLSRTPLPPTATTRNSQGPPGLTQAAALTEAVPKTEDPSSPEIPAVIRRNREPSEKEAILVELRKISAWADTQRKTTRWLLISLSALIPALIGFGMLIEQRFKATVEGAPPNHKPDWYEVERNVRSGDFEKAIALGEELIQKAPQYPEAHQRLAGAYLAAGKLDKAREHYAEAFRLFPSEENEKLLNVIEKRNNAEKPWPNSGL